MSSRPPRDRDSFLDELATRLGVVAARPASDDDRPTAQHMRLTEEMEIPSFAEPEGRCELDDLDVREPTERQLDPTSR